MTDLFPRNVLIHDGERLEGVEFKGEWIAVPMEDYRAAAAEGLHSDDPATHDPRCISVSRWHVGECYLTAEPAEGLDVERLARALNACPQTDWDPCMNEPREAAGAIAAAYNGMCSCGPWTVEGDPMFRTSRGSWHKGSCPLHAAP